MDLSPARQVGPIAKKLARALERHRHDWAAGVHGGFERAEVKWANAFLRRESSFRKHEQRFPMLAALPPSAPIAAGGREGRCGQRKNDPACGGTCQRRACRALRFWRRSGNRRRSRPLARARQHSWCDCKPGPAWCRRQILAPLHLRRDSRLPRDRCEAPPSDPSGCPAAGREIDRNPRWHDPQTEHRQRVNSVEPSRREISAQFEPADSTGNHQVCCLAPSRRHGSAELPSR